MFVLYSSTDPACRAQGNMKREVDHKNDTE